MRQLKIFFLHICNWIYYTLGTFKTKPGCNPKYLTSDSLKVVSLKITYVQKKRINFASLQKMKMDFFCDKTRGFGNLIGLHKFDSLQIHHGLFFSILDWRKYSENLQFINADAPLRSTFHTGFCITFVVPAAATVAHLARLILLRVQQ